MEELEKEFPCSHDGIRYYKNGQWFCSRCSEPVEQRSQRRFNRY